MPCLLRKGYPLQEVWARRKDFSAEEISTSDIPSPLQIIVSKARKFLAPPACTKQLSLFPPRSSGLLVDFPVEGE